MIEQIGNARHKTDSEHFQVKHFCVLFCCVCKLTKLNEKKKIIEKSVLKRSQTESRLITF